MDWIRQLLAVAAVLALTLASLAWLRRRGWLRLAGPGARAGKLRHLEPVDRLALTPQHSLHLVRMGRRLLLVGRSPSGITLLDSAEWGPEEEASQ
jgi:flagellar biogenesis protein FliO